MHSLLERQLRRAGFDYNTLPSDPVMWQEFLSRIERFYTNADWERQRLEESLKRFQGNASTSYPDSAPQLPAVLAAMTDGFCVFNNQGQLVFMNAAAEKYLNLSQGQALAATEIIDRFELHATTNPELHLSTTDLIQHLAEGYSVQDRNAQLQQVGHTPLPVSCVFNPVIESQQLVGYTLLFSDVSDIKNVEMELRSAKDAAEKASQAKSQFLSSMSHELRTPMNAILGYSELLKEDLSTPLDEFELDHIEDMLQYVGNILHAGWHLLELINKVLDLTRIEAGKLEVTIEKIEIIDLLKECVSFVSPQAEKRNITIYNEAEILYPCYGLADRGRLKQVIINLLSNAVKYNRDAGQVSIHLNQVDPQYLCLEVKDTGVGLTAEQKDKVFEPFTRVSGLNLIEGTGIGLTITKRLLEIMDGRIGVESEINVGSNFWIKIPSGEPDSWEQEPESASYRRYILLYVEDSRTNVSLVAQILKARPEIALMSAHTGEMGLQLANMHHPDVILLDINLPGMDGFEVLERLRDNESTKDIPVLALTANDNLYNIDRGREAGFLKYIVKPLDIKQFLEVIDYALQYKPDLVEDSVSS
jgi:signal transduction histidine kinase/ActR/RegA family two-component response regulator